MIGKVGFGRVGVTIVLLLNLVPQGVKAANHSSLEPPAKVAPKVLPPIRPRLACPTELEQLTPALLRDLPQYINRLSHQRGGSQARKYAIVASPAEMKPLPVVTQYPDPKQGGLYQIFFTVLERQYDTRSKTDFQNYYWLFLARTQRLGWQLAILYTRSDSYLDSELAASPLRDVSREVPGLAVRQWLRDCAARSVQFPLTDDSLKRN